MVGIVVDAAGELPVSLKGLEEEIVKLADPGQDTAVLDDGLKEVAQEPDLSKRDKIYETLLQKPGLKSSEKAIVRLFKVLDDAFSDPEVSPEGIAEKIQTEDLAAGESLNGKAVTVFDLLHHMIERSEDDPEFVKSFARTLVDFSEKRTEVLHAGLKKVATQENFEQALDVASIFIKPVAVARLGYAMRHAPGLTGKYLWANLRGHDDKKQEYLVQLLEVGADGVSASARVVSPLGKIAGVVAAPFVNWIARTAVERGLRQASQEGGFQDLSAALSETLSDPGKALEHVQNFGRFLNNNADLMAVFAAGALHGGVDAESTKVLKELVQRGFFKKPLETVREQGAVIVTSVRAAMGFPAASEEATLSQGGPETGAGLRGLPLAANDFESVTQVRGVVSKPSVPGFNVDHLLHRDIA